MEYLSPPTGLLLSLLRTELSVNTMIQALYKAGFICEHNIYDLSMEIMELVGFSPKAREGDELIEFYVATLDRLIEQHLSDESLRFEDIVMPFYKELVVGRDGFVG